MKEKSSSSAVEDHCHIATGAIINGGVTVGAGTFVGSNAVTREYSSTDKSAFIAFGMRFPHGSQSQ
jgi:acetyltransferase-like isoleucine patch superfamily enzyme